MIRFLILICIFIPSCLVVGAPPVEEIIKNTIAKIESDKKSCSKYTYSAVGKSIKYDGDMQPDEVTTSVKRIYQIDDRISEHISKMEKDGEPMKAKDIEKKIADQNKKWLQDQKEGNKKAASRDNYVDPLTLAGMESYSYHLTETRDSTFEIVTAAVAGTSEIIDQSVNKLTTYYVVQVLAKEADEKKLNAMYWIDANTYGLLRSEFTPSDMPRFVEMLDFRLEYQIVNTASSTLYLPKRFELKGKAGFLFFKGRFGVMEEYSHYTCDDTIADSMVAQRFVYEPEGSQGQ